MRQYLKSGTVRGVPGNRHSYRDRQKRYAPKALSLITRTTQLNNEKKLYLY